MTSNTIRIMGVRRRMMLDQTKKAGNPLNVDLIDHSTFINGRYIANDGYLTMGGAAHYEGFIRVYAGEVYEWNKTLGGTNRLAMYDKDKKSLGPYADTSPAGVRTVSLNPNVAFVRITTAAPDSLRPEEANYFKRIA